jgi:hypothetical protein
MSVLAGDVQDPRLPGPHTAMWRWQRIGKWALVPVVVAGAAGLMGPGPLCNGTVGLGDGAWLRYQRTARANATQELVLRLPERQGPVKVWLGKDLLDGVQVAQIQPAPTGQVVAPDGTFYTFETALGGEVHVMLRPRRAGMLELKAKVADGAPVELAQLVWP